TAEVSAREASTREVSAAERPTHVSATEPTSVSAADRGGRRARGEKQYGQRQRPPQRYDHTRTLVPECGSGQVVPVRDLSARRPATGLSVRRAASNFGAGGQNDAERVLPVEALRSERAHGHLGPDARDALQALRGLCRADERP